jgi:hypothetical protein
LEFFTQFFSFFRLMENVLDDRITENSYNIFWFFIHNFFRDAFIFFIFFFFIILICNLFISIRFLKDLIHYLLILQQYNSLIILLILFLELAIKTSFSLHLFILKEMTYWKTIIISSIIIRINVFIIIILLLFILKETLNKNSFIFFFFNLHL